jgi:hypothetical protein
VAPWVSEHGLASIFFSPEFALDQNQHWAVSFWCIKTNRLVSFNKEFVDFSKKTREELGSGSFMISKFAPEPLRPLVDQLNRSLVAANLMYVDQSHIWYFDDGTHKIVRTEYFFDHERFYRCFHSFAEKYNDGVVASLARAPGKRLYLKPTINVNTNSEECK